MSSGSSNRSSGTPISPVGAPLTGLVLMVELTHSGLGLMVPIIVATFLVTAIARHIDVYSARLSGHDQAPGSARRPRDDPH